MPSPGSLTRKEEEMSEKRYIRKPDSNQRIRRGDELIKNDAWMDTLLGGLIWMPVGIDPNKQEPGIMNDRQDQS
jgi:hypothetical protein